MKTHARLSGIIVPIATPLTASEEVDIPALRRLIQRCLEGGADGIFAGGTAGLGPLFTDDKWEEIMATAAEEVDGKAHLLGGVIAGSTMKARQKITFLERHGYQHFVLTPTYYITLQQMEEFRYHFLSCRESTSMHMIAYNIPQCTGSAVPLTLVEELAEAGAIVAMKESGGDRDYFRAALEMGLRRDLPILQGDEEGIEWGLRLGASGCVPVCANVDIVPFVEAWRAALREDYDALRLACADIQALGDILVRGEKTWIAGIMHALGWQGLGVGKALAPILPPSDSEKERIVQGLQSRLSESNLSESSLT